jgi:hypothetical protein
LEIESDDHLSLIAESEITWDLFLVSCGEIGNYWLVIHLGGATVVFDHKIC